MSEPKIKLVDEQTLPEKSVKVRITDAVSLNILKQIPETKHDEFLSCFVSGICFRIFKDTA